MERHILQVVIRAYTDRMGRNSQVERRMSGGRDVSEFGSVGSVVMGYGKLGSGVAIRVSVMGKLSVCVKLRFCVRECYWTYRSGLTKTHIFPGPFQASCRILSSDRSLSDNRFPQNVVRCSEPSSQTAEK